MRLSHTLVLARVLLRVYPGYISVPRWVLRQEATVHTDEYIVLVPTSCLEMMRRKDANYTSGWSLATNHYPTKCRLDVWTALVSGEMGRSGAVVVGTRAVTLDPASIESVKDVQEAVESLPVHLCPALGTVNVPAPTWLPSQIPSFMSFRVWLSSEYVYRIPQMGSTGSSVKGFVNSEFPDIIARICKHAFIPLAAGFGVATQVHFDAVVEAGAHGVVVGSRIASLIKEAPASQVPQVVENFCRGLQGPSPPNSSTAGVQSSQYHYPVVAAISRLTGMRFLLPRFGQYVPEALFSCLIELEEAHNAMQNDPMFWDEFESHYGYMNRPSKLYGILQKIWLKRQDLNHTGLHKIDNAVGQKRVPDNMVYLFRDGLIGREIKAQMKEAAGKLPDVVVACVGGGSNAIGSFYEFILDPSVHLVGVEAGSEDEYMDEFIALVYSLPARYHGDRHGATLARGKPGVLHRVRTYVLQDPPGQIIEMHSISVGLDYPGVGPEHSWLKDGKRAEYIVATDEEALRGFRLYTQLKGIISG
ncbi:tryptophan synthase beta subunit-like PLP-dependent enzyme [Pisolithus orientalis]|uniref:tryptophan synthase beta subunit-like PLP-dependent enzyme n=1 Tax=Pisolithus orientalis TaxID=936130 RepID=UPI002224EE82|nr:tryptophan synthase beta subunit-like PLP-dependent enzyme [Pisolithus orientalis]KAI5998985.1 tryptophan synthase beta subunit-like PLP-dependent enzyme [Pisolithus orientalis]